jgi:hypothetical protein
MNHIDFINDLMGLALIAMAYIDILLATYVVQDWITRKLGG